MTETRIQQHHVHDFVLSSSKEHTNPFAVAISADLQHEGGDRVARLPGFYDGAAQWRVRFRPTLEGVWRGRTSSEDPDLDGVELGPVCCVPSEDPHVRDQIGIDHTGARKFALGSAEGCVPLGFELDWMFALHQSKPEAFGDLIDRLAVCGFNYIVTNLYAHTGFSEPGREWVFGPPPRYVFGGTNDSPDHSRLNVEFFRDFDAVMNYLHMKGIVVHLMLQVQNKKVNWPKPRSPEDDRYWRYAVARYQAYPNLVWDVGKESYYLLDRFGSHDYTIERIRLIRDADAYGHLVTVHDSSGSFSMEESAADAACDFVSDQIHLGDAGAYVREATRRSHTYSKPYMNIEYGYEDGVEDIRSYRSDTTSSWQNVLLWTYAVYFGGGYPCYYYTNTAWDLIKFDPEPPGWERYRHLSDFLRRSRFNSLAPIHELVSRGFCLAEPGREYLVFLPEGGDTEIDLTAVPESASVECEWMDIYSGERESGGVGSRSFRTRLQNPSADASRPCVIALRAGGG